MRAASISIAAVQDVITCAPKDRFHVKHGAALVATSHIEQVYATAYTVRSQTTDDATSDGCGCVDARHCVSLRGTAR